MQVPQFDIFSGAIDKNALWLEAVDGLGAAFGRMKELASATPGAYFIFRTRTRQVLASIDTAACRKKSNRIGSGPPPDPIVPAQLVVL